MRREASTSIPTLVPSPPSVWLPPGLFAGPHPSCPNPRDAEIDQSAHEEIALLHEREASLPAIEGNGPSLSPGRRPIHPTGPNGGSRLLFRIGPSPPFLDGPRLRGPVRESASAPNASTCRHRPSRSGRRSARGTDRGRDDSLARALPSNRRGSQSATIPFGRNRGTLREGSLSAQRSGSSAHGGGRTPTSIAGV